MMSDTAAPWQRRTLRVLVISEWGALVLGILVALIETGAEPAALLAVAVAGSWVLIATAVPLQAYDRPYVPEIVALAGVTLTITAMTLTGASDSAFFLLALTPALHIVAVGGTRTGIATGGLTATLLLTVSYAQDASMTSAAGLAAVTLVVTLVMAQIRRILVDIEARSKEYQAASLAAEQRISELQHTHDLLTTLAATADEQQLSAPSVGRAALESLESRFPGLHGTVAVVTERGPVVVAAAGTADPARPSITIPLELGDRTVGLVVLETEHDLPPRDQMSQWLQPVTLAFANALLLQDMAGKAVNEERVRLARELHDEIGPTLASLGLSLDVAMMEAGGEPILAEHLRQLRETVGRVVDEVRTTVADLREGDSPSLTGRLDLLSADLPEFPPLVVDLDERRPARPSLAPQVHAIVVEAVRNAARHAGASKIRVSGWLDYDRGRILVEDDGNGFDPGQVPEGHYGLMGMKERAARAGVDFGIGSDDGGTRVVVEWGTR